ncbi:MAG: acetate kinase [Planctomycetes bacterium]|nr:acetate kinase [Planctomycetota bacterium]
MKILVVNCGSSSIKYQLFDMPERSLLAKGMVERIGDREAAMIHQENEKRERQKIDAADHDQAMVAIMQRLMGELGAAGSPRRSSLAASAAADANASLGETRPREPIGAVGHRVVHGGEQFTGSVRIDDAVLASIEEMAHLAPLHNPPNLAGIRAAMHALPGAPQVACFDTAFHATIPQVAYMYALPYELYEKLGVRRYGFHGTSHRYVARRAAAILGREKYDINCITCHLGNGSSITAVRDGRSVDTSMGLTPLEGLVMGTRCGDIDPAILFFLAQNGYEFDKLNDLCNKKSGVLGVSGSSNDMRTLIEQSAAGNERATLAIDIFCYRVKKYIGAYHAVLGRLDAIVFTGGIGENATMVREKICAGMEPLGIAIDRKKNEQPSSKERQIDAGGGVAILVVPTDEEGVIAADTYQLATQ